LVLLVPAQGHAQAPPSPTASPPSFQVPQAEAGFVSPYEIMKTVRSAGFTPLAPPLREGTIYVLRAFDFRGILMRVVVDAHTGAIRDANRIVPGPGRYGQIGSMVPPPYDGADFDAPVLGPNAGVEQPWRPPGAHGATLPTTSVPLPRPRPTALLSRRPDSLDSAAKGQPQPDAKLGTGVDASTSRTAAPEGDSGKPEINSEVITGTPPPALAAPKKPAVVPLND
jgi:hypothetical protein